MTDSDVFVSPDSEFISDYDSYKNYTHIKSLLYEGLDYNEHKTKVFAWYGVPQDMLDGEQRPAVILINEQGKQASQYWVNKWNEKGYIAIAINLEGQLPDNSSSIFQGPKRDVFFTDINQDMNNQWITHAVANTILANSLPRSFPEVNKEHIGLAGISWGGVIANIVAGEANIDVLMLPSTNYIMYVKNHESNPIKLLKI